MYKFKALILYCIIHSVCFTNFGYAQFFYVTSKIANLICDENFCSSDLKKFIEDEKKNGELDIILRLARNDRDRLSDEFINVLNRDSNNYDEHFSKVSDTLDKKRLEMLKLSNNTIFYNAFQTVIAFYNPSLGHTIPFIVYIVDQLNEAFYINTTLFIPISTIPKTFYFGKIIRHFCEILYDYMQNKGEIAGYFQLNNSKSAGAAFAMFKKVLAHSISRWIIWKMGEKNTLESGDEIVDQMSSLMSSLLRNYLNGEQRIDHDFVTQYINIFARNFKDANKQFNIILSGNVIIQAETEEIREQTFQYLKKVFKTEKYKDKVSQFDKLSPVIVIANGENNLKISIKDNRIFIFINSVDTDKISKAINILKKRATATDGFIQQL